MFFSALVSRHRARAPVGHSEAKREAFESLLSTCSAWANSAEDLDAELPELLWHVSGAGDSRGDANSGQLGAAEFSWSAN